MLLLFLTVTPTDPVAIAVEIVAASKPGISIYSCCCCCGCGCLVVDDVTAIVTVAAIVPKLQITLAAAAVVIAGRRCHC